MEEITLQQLLEAGCHFGHKAERWHPKARTFIYTEKDGIHVIDLVKTKAGLDRAVSYVRDLVAGGGELLLVGTKRQAQGVLKEEAEHAGAPYFANRWIGGFLTNWDSIKKNIDTCNSMMADRDSGVWKKYPKHEQVKLGRHLGKLQAYYGGVAAMKNPPQAVYIVDIKKEIAAVREAIRTGLPIIAIVDTNTDPTDITYAIPANDDAVGSIQLLTHAIAAAYKEGKELREKSEKKEAHTEIQTPGASSATSVPVNEKESAADPSDTAAPGKKTRGRPKKVTTSAV
ncbi:30S ribosomal protein S2 [Patescibacteria group bacterium]|nr:30S ribosomal protein S2 [Patescibacteria group bacterium]